MEDNLEKMPVTVMVPANVFDVLYDRLKRSGYASRYSAAYERHELDLSGIRVLRARPGIIGSDDPLDAIAEEMNTSSANERQVGGHHYGLGKLQHWDIVAMFNLDYFQGNITKYIFRWRLKGGLQDLEKAQHYLEKYIQEVKAKRIESLPQE